MVKSKNPLLKLNDSVPVIIPLLNPNEPEAMLAAVHVSEGQQVVEGELLCTLETTKSTTDLTAERAGYVIGLNFQQGDTVYAGEILCYLAEESTWTPPQTGLSPSESSEQPQSPLPVPEGLRITQPALALARLHGLNLAQLPSDRLVTESLVRAHMEKQTSHGDFFPQESAFDPTTIIIYGGGGHGKSLIDLLRLLGTYNIIGVVDDGISPSETIMGLPILGGVEVLPQLREQGIRLAINAVGGIGNMTIRIKVFQQLAEAGFAFPAVVHPTAFVETSASLSPGVQVFSHAYVGSEAHLGFGAIVNTGAIVSHDCLLGDFTNISPGAMLAGGVKIGAGALIGMGATINLQVKIGAGARIGNGATVKQDVPEKSVVRAGKAWPD